MKLPFAQETDTDIGPCVRISEQKQRETAFKSLQR